MLRRWKGMLVCAHVRRRRSTTPRLLHETVQDCRISTTWLCILQSQYHDIKPAKALGFKTAWIERRHDQLVPICLERYHAFLQARGFRNRRKTRPMLTPNCTQLEAPFKYMQGSGGTPETEEKATPDWRATSLGGLVEQHKQAAAATSKS